MSEIQVVNVSLDQIVIERAQDLAEFYDGAPLDQMESIFSLFPGLDRRIFVPHMAVYSSSDFSVSEREMAERELVDCFPQLYDYGIIQLEDSIVPNRADLFMYVGRSQPPSEFIYAGSYVHL